VITGAGGLVEGVLTGGKAHDVKAAPGRKEEIVYIFIRRSRYGLIPRGVPRLGVRI
jgi:hypothetical protein